MFNSQRIYSLLTAALLFSLLAPAIAEDGHNHAPVTNFKEGVHFHRISPAVETDVEEGKVEVLELFWYGCPHCFQFEPHLTGWKENMSMMCTRMKCRFAWSVGAMGIATGGNMMQKRNGRNKVFRDLWAGPPNTAICRTYPYAWTVEFIISMTH